jgi:2-phospho-L-lactate guanylyltransferase
VIAIVPVGTLEGAKSRLGAVLDAEERHDLAMRLARRTIGATGANPRIDDTLVVTPDDDVRELARELGARPIRQRSNGLNEALAEARAEALAAGADAVLILPIDLPAISPTALDPLIDVAIGRSGPAVGLVPDRHGRGTNALILAPPDVIGFCFGGDSRGAHEAAARAAGARLVELDGPLRLDLDTPDDLLAADDLLLTDDTARGIA